MTTVDDCGRHSINQYHTMFNQQQSQCAPFQFPFPPKALENAVVPTTSSSSSSSGAFRPPPPGGAPPPLVPPPRIPVDIDTVEGFTNWYDELDNWYNSMRLWYNTVEILTKCNKYQQQLVKDLERQQHETISRMHREQHRQLVSECEQKRWQDKKFRRSPPPVVPNRTPHKKTMHPRQSQSPYKRLRLRPHLSRSRSPHKRLQLRPGSSRRRSPNPPSPYRRLRLRLPHSRRRSPSPSPGSPRLRLRPRIRPSSRGEQCKIVCAPRRHWEGMRTPPLVKKTRPPTPTRPPTIKRTLPPTIKRTLPPTIKRTLPPTRVRSPTPSPTPRRMSAATTRPVTRPVTPLAGRQVKPALPSPSKYLIVSNTTSATGRTTGRPQRSPLPTRPPTSRAARPAAMMEAYGDESAATGAAYPYNRTILYAAILFAVVVVLILLLSRRR